MNNGNAFQAFVEESSRQLSQLNVIDYYQEPMPSASDALLDQMVVRFCGASKAERDTFVSSMTQKQRSLFGIFGHRAATLSVRNASPEQLTRGLIGAVIANYIIPARRQVEHGLAVYHHCAIKIGVKPVDLFEEAATFAGDQLAARMITFGRRGDVVLSKFGWRELKTDDGIKYKFDWGNFA